MSSGLTRGWIPVRVRKTRQIKIIEPASDSIRNEKALDAVVAKAATMPTVVSLYRGSDMR